MMDTSWEFGWHYERSGLAEESAHTGNAPISNKATSSKWVIVDQSISQETLSRLVGNGFIPIVQFDIRFLADQFGICSEMIQQFQLMGVKYIQPSGTPNQKKYWKNVWSDKNIFDRFYALFIPFARVCVDLGMKIVSPLLEPGGDFWDTVFLRSLLGQLSSNGEAGIIESLVLSASGKIFGKPYNWGDGGTARWPKTRPYNTPVGSEDHIGINTYQWYQEICIEVLQKSLPIFVYHWASDRLSEVPTEEMGAEFQKLLPMFKSKTPGITNAEIPSVCFFEEIYIKSFTTQVTQMDSEETESRKVEAPAKTIDEVQLTHADQVIFTEKILAMYVMIRVYEWGVADWHLELAMPLIKKHHATLGFSFEEARHARRVVLIGFDELDIADDIKNLRNSGCEIDLLSGDGTDIAQQLAMM